MRIQRPFATRVSRLLVFSAIAACGTTNPVQVDAGTSLAGTITCDDTSCGSGKLCRPSMNLPDDGGIPTMCLDVPTSCTVTNCSSADGPACASCVQELCGCSGANCFVIVQGRTIHC